MNRKHLMRPYEGWINSIQGVSFVKGQTVTVDRVRRDGSKKARLDGST